MRIFAVHCTTVAAVWARACAWGAPSPRVCVMLVVISMGLLQAGGWQRGTRPRHAVAGGLAIGAASTTIAMLRWLRPSRRARLFRLLKVARPSYPNRPGYVTSGGVRKRSRAF